MPDVGLMLGGIWEKISGFLSAAWDLLQATHIQEQIKTVDVAGLFANPWFLVPFVGLVLYLLYKQAFRDLIILTLVMGGWYVSGTQYMQTLVVGDELQLNKVLPLLFGGALVVAFVMYLLFGRSD